jgi:hypothetical protein
VKAPRAVGLALVAVASGALAPGAPADCINPPLDPFCGSRVIVSAVSGNTFLRLEEIDAVGDDPLQTVGPAHTTRLPDPGDPAGPGTLSDESAVAEIDFGLGVFATESGTESAVAGTGTSLDATATSRVTFDEYLSVSSASLALGTPVTLRLRYRIAFGAAQLHDLPPAALNNSSTQWARSDIQLYTTFGGVYLPHRWYESGDGTVIVDGIFSDPTQTGEMTAQATVGQTRRLTLDLRNETTSKTSVYSAPQFPNASTAATAALVFGIEADEPGVSITSSTFGAVPDFSGVTAANALANVLPVPVGAPVTIPEPSTLASELASCAVLLAIARRYAASHASA